MHRPYQNIPRPGRRRGEKRPVWKAIILVICLLLASSQSLPVGPSKTSEVRPNIFPTPTPEIRATQSPATSIAETQPTVTATPSPFPNYAEALQKSLFFYEVQRSGRLPANNRVEWRGDSALDDGADNGVDLTGGWYDAGDAVKFGFPMAASATMLAWGVVESRDAYVRSGQLQYALDNIRWVTDYFMKAHTAPNELWGQVGDADIDHHWWGPAEVMMMPRPSFKIDETCPGSDLAGETAAALAAASIIFRPADTTYADKLLRHAIQLYTFADTFRGKYSDCMTSTDAYYKSYSGYWDELVWGALWLYRATQDSTYLEQAEQYYDNLDPISGYKFTQSWDDKQYGCYALLAKLTGKARYIEDTERWLDYWTVGYQGKRITYTPGGLAWANKWGVLRYAANTAFIAFVYSDWISDTTKKARYHDFAVSQINYILGNNPRKSSYMVGYGNNPPTQPAHRNAHGSWANDIDEPASNRHIPYGALVGGPDQQDQFINDRRDYVTNEVATDYNAAFTGALARMVLEFGGQPLENFPPPEPRDDEFFAEASAKRVGANAIEVHAFLNNRSGWPPRISKDLSFRYFISLGDLLASGHSLDEVKVQLTSQDGAKLSPLRAWPGSSSLYFVEVDFSGTPIYPGGEEHYRKEVLLRISLPNTAPNMLLGRSKQWSLRNLGAYLKTIPQIPVYEKGKYLSGQEPSASSSNTP